MSKQTIEYVERVEPDGSRKYFSFKPRASIGQLVYHIYFDHERAGTKSPWAIASDGVLRYRETVQAAIACLPPEVREVAAA
jgi:hypothetical protein